MRSINGDEVEDVILEFEGDGMTQTAQASGFSLWKLMSSAARVGASSDNGLAEEKPSDEESYEEEESFTEDDELEEDPEDMASWPTED
jgi:hypothetical protein